jgi:transcription elongation factor GreA
MEAKPYYITKEGLEKLQEELLHRKGQKRREIAARSEKAKELGDLSENAEYAEAKDEMAFVEGRILELENSISRAVVISHHNADAVTIGARVTVNGDGKEKTYTIVGSNEADPSQGKISNETPLAQALIGRKIGEEIEVATPRGKIRYTIVRIE